MTQCKAITKSGGRCKNQANPDPEYNGLCSLHYKISSHEADDLNKYHNNKLQVRRHRGFFATVYKKRKLILLLMLGLMLLVVLFLFSYILIVDNGSFETSAVFNTLIVALLITIVLMVGIDPFGLHVSKFTDVDERSRRMSTDTTEMLREELRHGIKEASKSQYQKIADLLTTTEERERLKRNETVSTFKNYFQTIIKTLEEKASVADEKASILLDKGTSYSKWGIFFFIISIVAWQVLSAIRGYHAEIIFGVVSSSILFAFIEFLSAWFLRQYRHFVDTSTYLIKVKSIFDRYLLAYLLVTDGNHDLNQKDQKAAVEKVTQMLSAEIKWPDMQILKRGDVSFAKEAIDAMSSFAKNINVANGNSKS